MFGLLPLAGGILLGRFAPRRSAIVGQIVLYAVALAGSLATLSERHGEREPNAVVVSLALAVVAALSLTVGFALRARRFRRLAIQAKSQPADPATSGVRHDREHA